MPFSPSHRSSRILQSEIRAMTLACAKVNGLNRAQGVCDTEVPLLIRQPSSEPWTRGSTATPATTVFPNCARLSPAK